MKYRFLIDANLTVALEDVARERGHEAYHVRTLGRANDGDPVLLKLIEKEGYTLITNNIVEFRNRYRNRRLLHAGVIFIDGASFGRGYQIGAFRAALDYIEARGSIHPTNTRSPPPHCRDAALPDIAPTRRIGRSRVVGMAFIGRRWMRT